jgi:tetratricopeptide (TPR) repeat protein
MKKFKNPVIAILVNAFLLCSAVIVSAALFFATLFIGFGTAFADTVGDNIAELQHGWAKAYYQVPEGQKEAAFKELAAKAHQTSAANPGRPEPLVWEAIILSSYAKFAGGLTALDKVKASRDLLEQAEKIQPDVLNGSIYTSLGSLYYRVPRWPIAFGNKQKAREYLDKAIKVNPDGIDPNYFYGDFLMEQGEYPKAKEYLEKALLAPARVGREDADQGRRGEIKVALDKVNSKLK